MERFHLVTYGLPGKPVSRLYFLLLATIPLRVRTIEDWQDSQLERVTFCQCGDEDGDECETNHPSQGRDDLLPPFKRVHESCVEGKQAELKTPQTISKLAPLILHQYRTVHIQGDAHNKA